MHLEQAPAGPWTRLNSKAPVLRAQAPEPCLSCCAEDQQPSPPASQQRADSVRYCLQDLPIAATLNSRPACSLSAGLSAQCDPEPVCSELTLRMRLSGKVESQDTAFPSGFLCGTSHPPHLFIGVKAPCPLPLSHQASRQ